MRAALLALSLIGLHGTVAAAAEPAPTLECSHGYEGARATAGALAGATSGQEGGFDIISQSSVDDTWIVHYAFTAASHPAHPTVTLRTRIKQVTGVWTAQSKGCGFGDQQAFAALMAEMKQTDTVLTNVSRDEAEAAKSNAPLGAPP